MTAAAPIHHPDMDLLRADDHMDLASSPAMPSQDIDFELDDVREGSTEPNQDLMWQDEPEQPVAYPDLIPSATSDHADDDLMLDEETIPQPENRTDLLELGMHNPQDERAQLDEDDDILYEDEEDVQDLAGRPQGSLKEEDMGEAGVEGLQVAQQVHISDRVEDESQVATDIDFHADEETQNFEETNSTSEQQQTPAAGGLMDAKNDGKVSVQPGDTPFVSQEPGLQPFENNSHNDLQDEVENNEYNQAQFKATPKNDLDIEENAAGGHDSNPPTPTANGNISQPGTLESGSPQANVNSTFEESIVEPAQQISLLHTVKVHYLETEMCLFPPTEDDESEMFFLQDVSLAHESLDKMLCACRDVLANTIGQDDELVLDIASLGLHISEGSTYATQITLAQIIDVYIALASNDNATSIQPLYCTLSSRVCLISQYAYLRSAADEGKTLAQLLDENTLASAEDGGNGEDGGDSLEHEDEERHDQEVSAESDGTDEPIRVNKEEGVLPTLELEPTEEIGKDGVRSTVRGSKHGSRGESPDADENGPYKNDNGDLKKSVPHSETQSVNSAVKGDSDEFQGDYDNSLDLCFKPGTCSCSTCANSVTDTAALLPDKPENRGLTEDLLEGTAQSARESGPVEPTTAAVSNGVKKPDIESERHGSVSSRTLEAEINHLEEDTFSQIDQGSFTETQHDDVEDFELEEQNLEDTGLEADDSHGAQSGTGTEDHNPPVRYTTPTSNLDLSEVGSRSSQMHEENKEGTPVKTDDGDLLNFEDDEEAEKEKERNLESSVSARQPQVPGNEVIYSDPALNGSTKGHEGTATYHDDLNHSENGSSSQAIKIRRSQPPPAKANNDDLTQTAKATPVVTSGGDNGSKRKNIGDEDEFDFLDTATPDKKRRRPS